MFFNVIAQYAGVLMPAALSGKALLKDTGSPHTDAQTGVIASYSLASIPTLTTLPAPTRVVAWHTLYKRGANTSPHIAFAAGAVLGLNAWSTRGSQQSRLYLGAILATIAIVPWTLTVMKRTNARLMGLAAKAENLKKGSLEFEEEAELRRLLGWWTVLNYVRSVWPLVGAGLALHAALL